MYALAIIRYRRPLEEVLAHHEAHRAYLQELKARGVLVASGPLEPREDGGGVAPDDEDGLHLAIRRYERDPLFEDRAGIEPRRARVLGGVARHDRRRDATRGRLLETRRWRGLPPPGRSRIAEDDSSIEGPELHPQDLAGLDE
jgi:uncharacterized protein YciI